MEGFSRVTPPTDLPAGLSTITSRINPMSSEPLSPRPAGTDSRILRILEKSITEFIEKRSDEEIALIQNLPEDDVEAMFIIWQEEQITCLSKNWRNDWMRANVADSNLLEARAELESVEKKLESVEKKLKCAEEKLQIMREILEEKSYAERELEAQVRYLSEIAGEAGKQGMSAGGGLSLARRLKSSLGNRMGR